MNNLKKALLVSLTFLLLPLSAPKLQAELIFSAIPRETETQARFIYEPVAAYLSEVLGEKVRFHYEPIRTQYYLDMRAGKYDFTFDGPHLSAWRIANAGHEPLVRIPGKLNFTIIARSESDELKTPEDARFKTICSLPSPHMTAVVILTHYSVVSTPRLQAVNSGLRGIYSALVDEKICEAAIIPSTFFSNRLSQSERGRIKILGTTQNYPNQTLTAGPKIDASMRDTLKQALTSTEGQKVTAKLLNRFGGKEAKGMVVATAAELDGLNELLEGVVWGW